MKVFFRRFNDIFILEKKRKWLCSDELVGSGIIWFFRFFVLEVGGG